MSSWTTTFDFPAGTGNDMYMNVSNVVEVWHDQLWLARSTYLVTCQTFKSIPVLSLEQVDDETIVRRSVDLPLLLRGHLWRESLHRRFPFRGHLHRWRFVLDPIKILMQAIKDKREKLLRIVLIGTREIGGK